MGSARLARQYRSGRAGAGLAEWRLPSAPRPHRSCRPARLWYITSLCYRALVSGVYNRVLTVTICDSETYWEVVCSQAETCSEFCVYGILVDAERDAGPHEGPPHPTGCTLPYLLSAHLLRLVVTYLFGLCMK